LFVFPPLFFFRSHEFSPPHFGNAITDAALESEARFSFTSLLLKA
jgi:hypothetical protein